MPKISYARCSSLSLVISSQFTLEVCVTAKTRKKITKIVYFKGSKSFTVIVVDTPEKSIKGFCYGTCKQQVYVCPFSR